MILNENLQQMVLAVVEADVPKLPPQNPSCPATSVVLPVFDGAENIFTSDVVSLSLGPLAYHTSQIRGLRSMKSSTDVT